MFNVSTLSLKDTATLHLRHPVSMEYLYADPETKQKPVTIELYGTASKQYRNAVTAMQNRKLKRDMKKEKATAEVLKEESLKLLLACSAGSSELAIGKSPVNDEESFRALYSDPKLSWIRDQVDEALGDVSNFLEQSQTD